MDLGTSILKEQNRWWIYCIQYLRWHINPCPYYLTCLLFFTYCRFTFNAWTIKQRIQQQRVVIEIVTLNINSSNMTYCKVILTFTVWWVDLLTTSNHLIHSLKHILNLHRQKKAQVPNIYVTKTSRSVLKTLLKRV